MSAKSKRTVRRFKIIFAARLRYYRMKRNMSQLELGYRAGVRQGTISIYESGGMRLPNLLVAKRLAQALGISLGKLVGGSGTKRDGGT